MSKSVMEDVWSKLRQQHGDEGLFVGNDNMTTFTDVVPSGSYLLDDALGIWGLPHGRIIQFAGQESSGKTLMSLVAISEYQKANPTGWALFVDAEFTFDAEWATTLGVDLNRLLVMRENSAVKIFERLIGQPSKTNPNKKVKLGILDLEKENPSGLGIIVIDSIAAMTPPMEESSEVGKANIALLARFLPAVLRTITPMLASTGVILIGINQVRLDPGVQYGNPETSGGGKALKHACSMMLNFAKVNAKDSAILDVNGEKIGYTVRVRIDKNKLAPPLRVVELSVLYTKGITNKNLEIRDLAAKYGIIQRPNNKTWILDEEKYNGKDAIAEVLKDEVLQLSLFERIKQAKSEGVEPTELVNNDQEE